MEELEEVTKRCSGTMLDVPTFRTNSGVKW